MNDIELKPCPFCGGKAKIIYWDGDESSIDACSVSCSEEQCNMSIDYWGSLQCVVRAWNIRKPEDALLKKVEELTEKIEYILLSLYMSNRIPANVAVADLCDEDLDKSGRLLGRIRDRAYGIKYGWK